MKIIRILGLGCSNCKRLEANVRQAVRESGIEAIIEKVESPQEIMKYGIMRMPGLVVDGVVKAYGSVLTSEEIKKMIQ